MSTELARKLRRDPSEPERRMWAILFPLRRQGYNFRRQAQIGAYYADFACRHPAMVIEVDGETHATDLGQSNDATRDDYFVGRGYRVLRFWNNEVVENAEGVYLTIAAALAEISSIAAPPTLDPSPQRGRESTASPGARPSDSGRTTP
ncbi:endonuclease domain-containing protein [Devosia sp.]|uniref:endonuclease domain-containing protein n=1 Tax=Devosia sp. TaxID=1871048 RepID=UPI003F6F5E2F